jgi:hypothetical protein
LDDRKMPKDPSFNIRKIRNAIDRIGKSIFGRYPSVEMPQMKYYPQYYRVRGDKKERMGYDRSYIMVDYDF